MSQGDQTTTATLIQREAEDVGKDFLSCFMFGQIRKTLAEEWKTVLCKAAGIFFFYKYCVKMFIKNNWAY